MPDWLTALLIVIGAWGCAAAIGLFVFVAWFGRGVSR